LLLSVGHDWAEIQDYTVSQFKNFTKAAGRQQSRMAAMQLQITAVGSRGDEKTFEKMVDDLLK
jgi:hypothetical protein